MVLKCAEPKAAQEITLAVEKEAMLEHGAVFAFGIGLVRPVRRMRLP